MVSPAATPEKKASASRWPDALAWGAFGLLALWFLILKSFSLHWEVGDENIYLYMAWATSDHGALPYRDYFFAHPPLHLLPGVLLVWLAGVSPLVARLLPVTATLGAAGLLFLLGRRALGRLGAVVAVALYLGAFSLLRASSHWTGINLTVFWEVLGLWALLGARPALAGVAFALGVGTGNYLLPGALMALALAVLRSRRDGLRFALGFAGPWLAIQVLGLVIGGAGYWEGVYRYHFLKTPKQGVSRDMIARVATDNLGLFLGGLGGALLAWLDRLLGRGSGRALPVPTALAPAAVWWRRAWGWWRRALWQDGGRGVARIGALWALGYLLFIAVLPRVFPFYFLLLFPALALGGGFAVERLAAHLAGLLRARRTRGRAWRDALVALAALGLVWLAALGLRVPVQRVLLPNYVRGSDVPMNWEDAPLPSPLNRALHACCFDDVARAGEAYGTIQELLYHESRYFEAGEELSDFVRAHSRPEQVIFGDASTAPLVALLAGRRLAADFADSNTQRFGSGQVSAAEVIRQIDTPALAFVLVSGRPVPRAAGGSGVRGSMFAAVPAFRAWLEREFRVALQVRDRTKGFYFLLEPRAD